MYGLKQIILVQNFGCVLCDANGSQINYGFNFYFKTEVICDSFFCQRCQVMWLGKSLLNDVNGSGGDISPLADLVLCCRGPNMFIKAHFGSIK